MAYRDETFPEATVGAAYANGWRQLWNNFLILILIGIVTLFFTGVAGFFNIMGEIGGAIADRDDFTSILGFSMAASGYFLSSMYAVFVMAPINYGISYANLRAARSNRVDITDMFQAFGNYGNVVLASIIVTVLAGIGFMFLIIPGIIISCKLAFVPYLVVDEKINAVEAIQDSWHMTSGYAFKIFVIGLLGFPITILGLMCFGIGIIPAIMWIKIAYASLYHAVTIEEEIDAEMY